MPLERVVIPTLRKILPKTRITEFQYKALIERALGRQPMVEAEFPAPGQEWPELMQRGVPKRESWGATPINPLNLPGPKPEYPVPPELAGSPPINQMLGAPPAGTPFMEQAQAGMAPREEVLGRILKMEGPMNEPNWKPEDLPWEEARAKWLENPEMYTPSRGYFLPVERLQALEPGAIEQGLPEKIAYARQKYKPVETAAEYRVRKAIKESPSITEAKPVKEAFSEGMEAERIWKDYIGGRRTIAGKMWETLRASSRLHHKIKDVKQYFVSSSLRHQANPEAFRQHFPREARLLDEIYSELKKASKMK